MPQSYTQTGCQGPRGSKVQIWICASRLHLAGSPQPDLSVLPSLFWTLCFLFESYWCCSTLDEPCVFSAQAFITGFIVQTENVLWLAGVSVE
ncbi:hypothetical protein DPEC_G00012100 [Dallia pectoralis]|uniref:Uncharacterized protein n=1 Tax=Dallia pectoralis TaxID=75939 RepID=A0ACC2HMI6_DALPE|nr:hypothetical protein DPEC_G00012100 [Dallia pectoralis]